MKQTETHIIVVGAGPGGLSAAMILAHRGFKVTVFEQKSVVGGRNKALHLGDYTFDIGPTFLMMDFFLREIFSLSGRNIDNYLNLIRLEPMYKLNFIGNELYAVSDHGDMRARIAATFPGNEAGFEYFLRKEKQRYSKLYPCLRKDYSSFSKMLHPDLITALPYLAIGKSLYQNLGNYFHDELCKLSFTFQAKYLGMSPWTCPGLFTIIPYIEHSYGIYHVENGLHAISLAMQKVVTEHGGVVKTGQKVKQILVNTSREAHGVELENGEIVSGDAVIINADFGHAMQTLFAPGILRYYTSERLARMHYSCSTFMIYLGLDTLYQEPHHQIIFAHDYRKNITEISYKGVLSKDLSLYVRNGSVTDATLAPKEHSALYILVPVPNLLSNIVWNEEEIAFYREKVLMLIEQRTSMSDLRRHIVTEHIITPYNWWTNLDVFNGATFNLAHNLFQMLYFRPHNRFQECRRCYLAGGGTHPGSGLPTIYESARITAELITKDCCFWK